MNLRELQETLRVSLCNLKAFLQRSTKGDRAMIPNNFVQSNFPSPEDYHP